MPLASLTSSPPSALTTTKPRPARAMTTMNRMAADTTTAAGLPSSVRAISASDLPPRRTDAASTSMSCTAPARQTPITSQSKPGHVAVLDGQHRTDQRPAPEMAAKWWPNSTHLLVGS